ncbi:hypothetical protein WJX72_004065 [[Myrmecia] bisecta]|uniref:Plasma membrane proteolipid 3 n=1 Tax=[Myrmecia] bisecta TaxID=41462 RepID=A0AAW1Q4C6_9CHLO
MNLSTLSEVDVLACCKPCHKHKVAAVMVTLTDIGLLILAVLLPPLAVFLGPAKGHLNQDFFINVLLTLLAWLPGQIHAIYLLITTGSAKKK